VLEAHFKYSSDPKEIANLSPNSRYRVIASVGKKVLNRLFVQPGGRERSEILNESSSSPTAANPDLTSERTSNTMIATTKDASNKINRAIIYVLSVIDLTELACMQTCDLTLDQLLVSQTIKEAISPSDRLLIGEEADPAPPPFLPGSCGYGCVR